MVATGHDHAGRRDSPVAGGDQVAGCVTGDLGDLRVRRRMP